MPSSTLTAPAFGTGIFSFPEAARILGLRVADVRAGVASRIWCKCRGRKLRLVMLGGGCNDVWDHYLPGALERRAEQLMA